MSSNIQVAALSDIGCVRTNNEDNYGYDPALDLYVVCDGMGGMAAGEVASSVACGTVISVFASQPPETPVEVRLSLAIRAANDAVRSTAHNTDQHGMGTTLVSAVIRGSRLLIGNVGDSRAYRLQGSTCSQLTIDHSYINELIRQGNVKVEDVPNLDLKGLESVITRAIGAANDVEPDFFFVDLIDGDTIILASDGLTRYVGGDTIGGLVTPNDLEASCQRLINAAKDAGGADNVTCILLCYHIPVAAVPEPPPLDVLLPEASTPVLAPSATQTFGTHPFEAPAEKIVPAAPILGPQTPAQPAPMTPTSAAPAPAAPTSAAPPAAPPTAAPPPQPPATEPAPSPSAPEEPQVIPTPPEPSPKEPIPEDEDSPA